MRTASGNRPAPRRIAQLAPMFAANQVFREDERTLVIVPEGGFLGLAIDRLLANPYRRFQAGEIIQRTDFAAEVRSVESDGRPLEVAFRFRQPLNDPGLRWLYWKNGKLVAFPLPAVGERVVLNGGLPIP